jgi:hypothetical protein
MYGAAVPSRNTLPSAAFLFSIAGKSPVMSRNVSTHLTAWLLAFALWGGIGSLRARADTEDIEASGLREIAVVQAERGDVAGAKKTVWLIDDKWSQMLGLRDIAMIQAEHKDLAGAKKTIWLMGDKRTETLALRDLAVIQAEQRDIAGAKKTVWLMGSKSAEASALREIAAIQAARGDVAGAKKTVWLSKP